MERTDHLKRLLSTFPRRAHKGGSRTVRHLSIRRPAARTPRKIEFPSASSDARIFAATRFHSPPITRLSRLSRAATVKREAERAGERPECNFFPGGSPSAQLRGMYVLRSKRGRQGGPEGLMLATSEGVAVPQSGPRVPKVTSIRQEQKGPRTTEPRRATTIYVGPGAGSLAAATLPTPGRPQG